jgi:hypothetical protein
MADVYIVYASEDRNIAKILHDLISEQWTVWWDDYIVGPYSNKIEKEIEKSGCVIALFSRVSREKITVLAELDLAVKLKRIIIPIKIEAVEPTYPHNINSTIDLSTWNGEYDNYNFLLLQKKLAKVVMPRKKPKRPSFINKGSLPLPTFFFSVSSYDTQLKPPNEAISALRIFGVKNILVSAYDLVSRRNPIKMIDELKKYRDNGGFVLIDSGNYEKSRLGSRWKPSDLHEVLGYTPHDWVFCFDVMKPKNNPKRAIEEIVSAVTRDKEFTSAPILPIVHVTELNIEHLPSIVCGIADQLEPPLIAIPERELGPGLIARAKTVQKIRKALSELPFYQPIHILGAGNPWSIPILVAAGADTFDGLEWCRMVVDQEKDRLHHFHHFDFFTYQTEFADSSITKNALKDPNINYAGKVAFHNLDYFVSFMEEMRQDLKDDNIESFVSLRIGKDARNQIKQQLPDLFK